MTAGRDLDVDGLGRRLRATVDGEVALDPGTRALYTTDASNYRRVPLAVVVPRHVDDVVAAVAACAEFGAPIVPRGGGTSVAGNACGGVVLDTSRYLGRILDLDPERRRVRVEPGIVLDDLGAATLPFGLAFGPDPSTHSRCTVGGMIGNNACGAHSVAWGKTSDNVEELDVLLADGTRMTVGATPPADLERRAGGGDRDSGVYAALRDLVIRHEARIRNGFPAIPRRVSGYALDQLLPERGFHVARALVGTEGTCVTVLGATLRLLEVPPVRALVVLGFPDMATAGDAGPGVLPLSPLTVEGLDHRLLEAVPARRRRLAALALPEGQAWLLVETGGETRAEATGRAGELAAALQRSTLGATVRLVDDPVEQRVLWRIREEGAGLATRRPDGAEAWPGWEDAAVPPERLGSYLRQFEALLQRHGRDGVMYGHFGEGCVHVRIDFDLLTPQGVASFRRFIEDAADLVVAHGGSLSGEHGDGRARGELLERMYGPELVAAFAEFKRIWDPAGRMNPGVAVQSSRLDEDLRLGPGYRPGRVATVLALAEDRGSFASATRRCVGVGKCRQAGGGVMCPSYQVTREERHSTRGRAHLLFEMLRGDLVTRGWRSEEVREALDLCLACKGCKSDCPVAVDMATYKAEFLHHHYARRLRPASHYSMGFLPLWVRLASLAPGAVNRMSATPGPAAAVKRLAGVAPERRLPEVASEPFTRWFHRRARRREDGRRVLLWPDTFNTFFSPEVARAATTVLEAAGLSVVVPRQPVCCGLTWLSTGQLRMARRVARRSLAVLRPYLEAGLPVVGLEPSCTTVFRADLAELLPGDRTARLARERAVTLAELLTSRDWTPPRLDRSVITQVHCHQHAVLGFAADEALLAAMGVEHTALDSGCCGLAGNFGFERGHYEVSKACAERVLLPAVRAASPDTLIVADGFSCRTQIEQEAGRRALHLAQLLEQGSSPPTPPTTGLQDRKP
ncbi:MAG: FAD-binding oxidoreductase [Actinomycetota bacterium]|nr:FAD-binding oxidoreductase [Actinomycetota bacterium]